MSLPSSLRAPQGLEPQAAAVIADIQESLGVTQDLHRRLGQGTSLPHLLEAFITQTAEQAAELFPLLTSCPLDPRQLTAPPVTRPSWFQRVRGHAAGAVSPPPRGPVALRRLGGVLGMTVGLPNTFCGVRMYPVTATLRGMLLGSDGVLRLTTMVSQAREVVCRPGEPNLVFPAAGTVTFLSPTDPEWGKFGEVPLTGLAPWTGDAGVPHLQVLRWLQDALQHARHEAEQAAAMLDVFTAGAGRRDGR